MGIISWIILGLLAGALAKLIMPGDQKGGCVLTTVLGIVGAIVGGWIGSQLGLGKVDEFSLGSLGLATIGALIVLGILALVSKKA